MTKREDLEQDSNRIYRSGLTAAPVFLVLERDPLIAEDIKGALQVILPCHVLHAGDASEIASMLSRESRISAAFLNMPFAEVVESGLDKILDKHSARIILTDGEDDQARALARGWALLVRPFTEEMIRDLVSPRHLRDDRSAFPCKNPWLSARKGRVAGVRRPDVQNPDGS